MARCGKCFGKVNLLEWGCQVYCCILTLKRQRRPGVSAVLYIIRATGIEPVSHAWEARVLPLNDARIRKRADSSAGCSGSQDEKNKFEKIGIFACQVGGAVILYRRVRGYSLMVKLQPSKLIMRVRFPLPA